ncbi:hypothetical protein AB0K09_25225 [Streptomyces sp. NPDC049577]|uniref:hypothetical protein n=1 Tax=Streptomyces sp. NPDC049577 TaxID=3155153 RepID=UPI00343D4F56
MTGIDGCLAEAMTIPGARGASLVDWTSGLSLAAAGTGPGIDHETAAVEAAELARTAVEGRAFTRGGAGEDIVEELILTARGGYHLIRFVETGFDSSVLLYLWLDRAEANLAVALFRLKDLTTRLVLA